MTTIEEFLFGIIAVILFFVVILFIRIMRIEKRLKVFFQGRDAKSLEEVTMLLRKESMEGRKAVYELREHMNLVKNRLQKSVQKVGMVRFNPFRDAGGDHSFSVALLDDSHDGVVISSLYSRDGVRVYGKPILGANSAYQLSEEEEQAIKKAMQES